MQEQGTLSDVVELMRIGNDEQAREILKGVLKQQPNNADAWYLASFLAVDEIKKREILDRALIIDPNHRQAQLAMQQLNQLHRKVELERQGKRTRFAASVILIELLIVIVVIGIVGTLLFRPAHSAMPEQATNLLQPGIEESGDAALCASLLQNRPFNVFQDYTQQLKAAVERSNFTLAGALSGRDRLCPIIDNFAYAWQLVPQEQFRSQAWQDFQSGWNSTSNATN